MTRTLTLTEDEARALETLLADGALLAPPFERQTSNDAEIQAHLAAWRAQLAHETRSLRDVYDRLTAPVPRTHEDVAAADRDGLDALRAADQKRIAEMREALVWCSGAQDFAPGGRARVGWERLCAPLLALPLPVPPRAPSSFAAARDYRLALRALEAEALVSGKRLDDVHLGLTTLESCAVDLHRAALALRRTP